MAQCPKCGSELLSTEETGERLGVSGARVRRMISGRPNRLGERRLGCTWVVPGDRAGEVERQPSGVHLSEPPEPNSEEGAGMKCPGCGEEIFSPRQVADLVGISTKAVYRALHGAPAESPDRLEAFRIGGRWAITATAIKVWQDRREQARRFAEALLAAAAGGHTVRLKVDENCLCDAYTFPHRPGGGRCQSVPGAIVDRDVADD